MRFAYADPPYLGCSATHYSDHPEHAVYDTVEGHKTLIDRLVDEFPDGWALSMASTNLRTLLPLCPDDVRVGSWTKPFAAFKANVTVAYAWEPVVFRGGRKRSREQDTVRDWVAVGITLKRGLTGVKPDEFCNWIFSVLNIHPGDEFVDVFHGSGAVTRAWDSWQRQRRLFA